jgi:hypothetical protein
VVRSLRGDPAQALEAAGSGIGVLDFREHLKRFFARLRGDVELGGRVADESAVAMRPRSAPTHLDAREPWFCLPLLEKTPTLVLAVPTRASSDVRVHDSTTTATRVRGRR